MHDSKPFSLENGLGFVFAITDRQHIRRIARSQWCLVGFANRAFPIVVRGSYTAVSPSITAPDEPVSWPSRQPLPCSTMLALCFVRRINSAETWQ